MLRLRAAAASDAGAYRDVNQDAAFAASWGAGVADGVGGGPAGDLASAALVHRLVAGSGDIRDAVHLAVRIREANWDVGAHARRDPSLTGMATTFTGLFVGEGSELIVAHTGDSRGYRLRDGVLTRETRDDSYVQELVDRGLLSPADAASHPRRNIITASLHGGETDTVTVTEHSAYAGDRWMLCSDGVSDYLPEADLRTTLSSSATSAHVAHALVRLALEAGSRDNVTAVVCDVERGAPDRERPEFAGSAAVRFREEFESA
ncbi:PP2C family protein-serine/threonine phosphatase [Microbacterium rhizomatis]|uniref:Serine/threonine-protein phosphatase n=1 Tax=Microbacterium rhizomatis TaxID=1631477 RepID=A0A5J5J7Y6_9MICO|nr:protein phosphatase 2C domain-containing protein [Microbacterium rhizomatis]KAA9110903.1 serine/threonine-protein phosphatase [Microbacterium rhizomatis]